MAWKEITTSKKIIGHISAGVYRGAGGALKELISNAYDADATRVTITTNWPSFDIVTCHDNGTGMTLAKFNSIMSGGIGDSTKREDNTEISSEFKRPLIGRLGIGMLGIAQICHEFKIISHHSSTRTAFESDVKLVDHLREKVEQADANSEKPIEVGRFNPVEIEYDEAKRGTWVIATDMRAAFVRKFREKADLPLPSKFAAFIDTVQNKRSVAELGDYWQMMWELSISCPIPYVSEGPFNWSNIICDPNLRNRLNELFQLLENYNFEVVVDGLSLRKPNMYPMPKSKRDGSPLTGEIFPIYKEAEVYGRPIKLTGYIYLQDGQAVEPIDLRGLLIRIKNVAIGGYDTSFLAYPKIEGPRFNWLSGEVYVEEGLEQALNIDRDSFNQMHSHFVYLQQAVHLLLPEVFSEASAKVRQRSQSKNVAEQSKIADSLQDLVKDELGSSLAYQAGDPKTLPVSINTDNDSVVLNTTSALWPKSKSKREMAQLIAIAYEISMQSPEQERRERFYNLISKILDL